MTLRIVGLIVTFVLGILVAPLAAEAQLPGKVPRVGQLWHYSPADVRVQRLREAFRQGLVELGYVEGQNVTIDDRYAEGELERLPELAAELVHRKVDVIVTGGDAGVQAAKQATRTIPIVVAVTGDLVGPGHVASLARPGGNITGLTVLSPELSGKRLELVKETFPKVSRVAVLWNPGNAVKILDFRATEVAAKALGVQLQSLEVRGADEFGDAFQAAIREHADVLFVLSDALIITHRSRIVDFTAKNQLPGMFENASFVEEGGLMAYGVNLAEQYRRAATYVAKILKGAKPADLPVEQPMKFELIINLKTAKALGLTIPPSVLFQADRVIQ